MGRNYQEDPEKSVYVATYQDFDGSNYTLAGLGVKFADRVSGFAEVERNNFQNLSDWRTNTSCNIGCRIKF